MSSLVAPPQEQATVVPSEPQARNFSRNSQSQSITSTRNVSFRRHDTVQPLDWRQNHREAWQHYALGDQYGASLSQTRNGNCHSSASWSAWPLRQGHPLHSSLDQALRLQTRVVLSRSRVWLQGRTTRLQREGLSGLILMWPPACLHCRGPDLPWTELSSMHALWVSITNDSSKSHGYHLQIARLRWTSSGRSICLYPSKKWKMLQNYWKFQNRSVQTFGFVYHDTNGLNHGPFWKIQSFLLKGICTVILWQDFNGKANLRKILLKYGWREGFQLGMLIRTVKKDYSCLCMWMT